MRTLLVALCLPFAAGSARAEGLPAFAPLGAVGYSELRAVKPRLAVPAGAAADVISRNHLLVQAGKDVLFGFAETDAEYQEAAAYWSAALEYAGVEPGAPRFEEGMYKIPYRTPDGGAVRVFLADPRQFPPQDEVGLRANLALVQAALARAGLPLVAGRVVNVDLIPPTYAILYRTRPEADPAREKRLRVLAPGHELDFEVYRSAGVDVIQTPKAWLMVYLGPEVGYVSLAAKTPADLSRKLAERKELLLENGKRIIATRAFPLDDPEYKCAAGVYSFQ